MSLPGPTPTSRPVAPSASSTDSSSFAGCAQALDQLFPNRSRIWARLAGGMALAIVLISDVLSVRATLEDADRVSKANCRLLAEAKRVAANLPLDRAIVVLRLESENPLLDVAKMPRGLAQPWFQRHEDPYGLIDAGALFDWTRCDERVRFTRIDDWSRVSGRTGVLAAHVSGGFLVPPESVPDATATAHAWQNRGVHVRVIQAEALPIPPFCRVRDVAFQSMLWWDTLVWRSEMGCSLTKGNLVATGMRTGRVVEWLGLAQPSSLCCWMHETGMRTRDFDGTQLPSGHPGVQGLRHGPSAPLLHRVNAFALSDHDEPDIGEFGRRRGMPLPQRRTPKSGRR